MKRCVNVAAFFEHDTCTAGSLNRVYTALGVSFHFALHETRRSKVLSFGMSVCETKKKERDERIKWNSESFSFAKTDESDSRRGWGLRSE